MEENKIGLKPCPFCGRTPQIRAIPTGQRKSDYMIFCVCGVRTILSKRKYRAVEIWNRRADDGLSRSD